MRRLWPAQPLERLQRRLVFLVMLAAGALVCADAVSLWSGRHQLVTGALAESSNLARSLADQAAGVFQTTGGVLADIRAQIERGGSARASLDGVRQIVTGAQNSMPMLHHLLVLDSQGQPVNSLDAAPRGAPGRVPGGAPIFPQSAYFAHHLASPDRTAFVGWPVQDPVDGSWQITVSCRLDAPNGGFAGAVVAFLPISFFSDRIGNYDVGQHGVISLVREDGTVIARQPFDPHNIGRRVTLTINPAQHDKLEDASPIDGTIRLDSYVRLPDTPLFMLVGRSKAEVLAGWRLLALSHGLALAVVLGALWALTWRLSRSIGESEQASQLLRQSYTQLANSEAFMAQANQRLELAEQLAQVGHWRLELSNSNSMVWSDEVYRLHGVDKAHFVPTGQHVINAYHPDDRNRMRKSIREAISTGMPFELLARIVWPDGTLRHVVTRGFYQPALPGAAPSVFGVIIDVTEQKRTEAALVEANAAAEQANAALEAANKTLQAMALQDSLTGLANRRHFDRSLDQEYRRSVRAGICLGLILLDVDKFKEFNDIYGHQAGDGCLRAIASTIPLLLNRPGDIAARYGGEEIALLLPGTTESGARALAERVAQAVRDLGIAHAGSPHGMVTISAGVEAFVPVREVDTAALLVERADLALYAAKRTGRNRVLTFREMQDAEEEAKVKVFQG